MTNEIKDQGAHFLIAILILLPVALFGLDIYTGAFAGLFMGFIREITEQSDRVIYPVREIRTALRRSKLDLSFWTLGGATAGLIA